VVGWDSDAEIGGTVPPLCPLEHLSTQFDPTTKLTKSNGRTGESPLSGAVLIPALDAVLIQVAVTGLSHTLSFSTGHAANACSSSPDTTRDHIPRKMRAARGSCLFRLRERAREIACLRGHASASVRRRPVLDSHAATRLRLSLSGGSVSSERQPRRRGEHNVPSTLRLRPSPRLPESISVPQQRQHRQAPPCVRHLPRRRPRKSRSPFPNHALFTH
jgi:hypothetical protein